jgi:hypothetical protein
MAIDLKPGEVIKRTELHERYGGRRQGGISPSKQSPNVFVFTDAARGVLHGYVYDGWRRDGFYHYTGEGQRGDQRMAQGNRAIRDHQAEGRTLHVFDSSAGVANYMGEFQYVDHYLGDAPETGEGPIRSVIVFRLQPLNDQTGPTTSRLDDLGQERLKEVPVEQHLTERVMIDPRREPYEAERREQQLVRELMASLLGEGHEICRLQLRPTGEPAALFCDLFDQTTNTLVEAKGTIARPAFRMAIGQLADYARFVDPPPSKVILVPEAPRPDLLQLAASQGIEVTWPNQDGEFVGAQLLT